MAPVASTWEGGSLFILVLMVVSSTPTTQPVLLSRWYLVPTTELLAGKATLATLLVAKDKQSAFDLDVAGEGAASGRLTAQYVVRGNLRDCCVANSNVENVLTH